jgi:hypothetical protein
MTNLERKRIDVPMGAISDAFVLPEGGGGRMAVRTAVAHGVRHEVEETRCIERRSPLVTTPVVHVDSIAAETPHRSTTGSEL